MLGLLCSWHSTNKGNLLLTNEGPGWGCSSLRAVLCSAVEILMSRQKKAEALKKLTDVAVRMSEEQLVELRADIKVSFSLLLLLTQTLCTFL